MMLPPPPDPAKAALFSGVVKEPPEKTFEIGLVLGGTVSAGAYTAGALDLLIQALDDFYLRNGDNPPHAIKLSLAAGSSGGAVCSALLGAMLNRKFLHVTTMQADLVLDGAGPADNLFWDLWVNRFNFAQLMEVDDLNNLVDDGPKASAQHVPALLNAKMIDYSVATILTYANEGGDFVRPWVAQPFRIATTVCNLRGIPYTLQNIPIYDGYTGGSYVQHDDYAWFALPNVLKADDDGRDEGKRRPDEFWVSIAPRQGISVGFDILASYACASGAMPVGLPARSLKRPAEHYVYRPSVRPMPPGDNPPYTVDWPQPNWPELTEVAEGQDYTFTAVDGGTFNNDPVKIAHQALAGLVSSNPREPDLANRALFMIDPLADQPDTLNRVGRSLVAVAGSMITTFVGGGRYLTSDLELFANQNVFSRFQLVPSRSNPSVGDAGLVGEAALAGTDLMALGGWCARPFRVHDYLLGRWNMTTYLRREFLLRGDNPVFAGWCFDACAEAACALSGDRIAIDRTTPRQNYWLPVIPLPPDDFGALEPTWPVGALDPQSLLPSIQTRADAVLTKLRGRQSTRLRPLVRIADRPTGRFEDAHSIYRQSTDNIPAETGPSTKLS